jgi:hypothetical protein
MTRNGRTAIVPEAAAIKGKRRCLLGRFWQSAAKSFASPTQLEI